MMSSDQEIRNVAQMANALEFIEKDTYDFDKDEDKKALEAKFYSEVR